MSGGADAGPASIPFRGFSPPRWIVSRPALDDLEAEQRQSESAHDIKPSGHGRGKGKERAWDEDVWGDGEEVKYGPQLKRRGNVKFVRAKEGVKKEEVEEDDKGAKVKGMYESIIIQATRKTPIPRPPRPPRPRLRTNASNKSNLPKSPKARPDPSVDVDLTISSDSDIDCISIDDSSDDISIAEPEPEPESDDDDIIIIINPLTSLPYPRPRSAQPRALHDLIAQSNEVPFVPPIKYGISSTNVGWKMLAKQGWKEGEGLGRQTNAGVGGDGLESIKVPLRSSNKFDKRGLGLSSPAQKHERVEREEELQRKRAEDRLKFEKRGIGMKGMAARQKQESRDRRHMIKYMNS